MELHVLYVRSCEVETFTGCGLLITVLSSNLDC
jgi:hypothetical protein